MTTSTPTAPQTTSTTSRRFGFPELVDEAAARVVAAGVVMMTIAYLATGSGWVLFPLVSGFAARVAAGPTFSPLARLAIQVIVPALPARARLVPGPPKRFAQAIGAALSTAAAVAHLAGASGLALVLIAMITGAALLESALGFCLGCTIFGSLMRAGVIPETTCEACNDLSNRPGFAN